MDKDEFITLYNTQIKPKLKKYERSRVLYCTLSVIFFIFGYSSFVLYVALPNIQQYIGKYYILGAFCLLIFYLVCGAMFPYFNDKLEQRLKKNIMPILCDYIGNIKWAHAAQLFLNDTTLIERSMLLPPYGRITFDDTFRARTQKGSLFKISEVVYGGYTRIFIFLRLQRKNYSNTVLMPKGNLQYNYVLQKITLEDVIFNRIYDVYSDDEVEARFLLNPVFMEKLSRLKKLCGGQNIGVSFFVDNMVVMIESNGDAFQLGSIFSPIDNEEQFFRLYNEIITVIDLVEYMEK